MRIERREAKSSVAVLKWLFRSRSFNDCSLQTLSPPNVFPGGLQALAIVARSFSALPAPRVPRAALGTAIPLLPLFAERRDPRFHQPDKTEKLRSCCRSRSRPCSHAGALPAASHGGLGGREKAEASAGSGLFGGGILGETPKFLFREISTTFLRLLPTGARGEARRGEAACSLCRAAALPPDRRWPAGFSSGSRAARVRFGCIFYYYYYCYCYYYYYYSYY